jgi:hypothetical protein
MTQHAPSTGLVGFHCNSNGRTAYTGVYLKPWFDQINHNNNDLFCQGGFDIIPLVSF